MVEQTPPPLDSFFDFRPSPPSKRFSRPKSMNMQSMNITSGPVRSCSFLNLRRAHTYEQGWLQVSLYQYYSARGLITVSHRSIIIIDRSDIRIGSLSPIVHESTYIIYIYSIYIAQRQIILYLLWFKVKCCDFPPFFQ